MPGQALKKQGRQERAKNIRFYNIQNKAQSDLTGALVKYRKYKDKKGEKIQKKMMKYRICLRPGKFANEAEPQIFLKILV